MISLMMTGKMMRRIPKNEEGKAINGKRDRDKGNSRQRA